MSWTSISFDDLSDWSYRLAIAEFGDHQVTTSRGSRPIELLRISFQGSWDRLNPPHAFACGVMNWALSTWGQQADGLLLDFREVTYSWGDEMQNILSEPNRVAIFNWKYGELRELAYDCVGPSYCPTALIVSESCREGLESLVRDEMDGWPHGKLVESEDEAIEYIHGLFIQAASEEP